jgi:hypothetical protein
MSLEQIYEISQTLASLAVVVSLVILIQQNRQANQLARDAAMRIQVEGLQEISRALYETQGLADVWHRGNTDLSSLSDADRVRYVTFLTYTLRIWEGLHAQQAQGKIDADLWRSHTQLLRSVQALSGAKAVWDLRRHYFSKAFQDFYATNARSEDVRELYLPPEIR